MNYTCPKILTPPPGPKAREIIKDDTEMLSPSLTRTSPLVGERAEGVFVEDVDGNVFLDFGSGIAVTALGHRHPEVIAAMKAQMDKLTFINSLDYYTIPQVDYAKMLFEVTPGTFKKRIFYTNSGSEAVETAIKMAKWHNRRPYGIGFINGFHGRTLAALSFTTNSLIARRGFAPAYPIGQFTPFPHCYRCLFDKKYPECDLHCLNYLTDVVLKKLVAPDETSFIILEAVQGAGGYIVPPKEFFPRLAQIAKQHNIQLIVDEVQTGFARTGKMFACDHFGLEPDILALSKGIANGFPCGAAVARAEVMDWKDGAHEGTLNGNPVIIEGAKAVLTVLKRDNIPESVTEKGAYFREQLEFLKEKYPIIGDVRGLGLMLGVEFIKDVKKTPAKEFRDKMIDAAFQKGLMLLGAGESSLRMAPPLIITKNQIDMGLTIIEDCIKELS